jgi:type II secretory pathway component PulM
METPMRKKRELLTEEQRIQRDERQAQSDADGAAAEDKAIDAMIRRSIEIHGP